jgi:sedoheptulokinase
MIEAIMQLQADLRRRVSKVAFCGQMHGVVLWDHRSLSLQSEALMSLLPSTMSPLVTWEDTRCSPDFLISIGCQDELSSGFGIATMAWMAKKGSADLWSLSRYTHAAPIHGLLAWLFAAGGDSPVECEATDAHAWGLFGLGEDGGGWQSDR